jgi:hypothetical protein
MAAGPAESRGAAGDDLAELRRRLSEIDVDALSPREAQALLYELVAKAKS